MSDTPDQAAVRSVLQFSLIITLLGAALAPPAAGQAAESLRDWRKLADKMVGSEIVAAGVTNKRVVEAVRDTPRHEFVPLNQRDNAYLDMALPIGEQQTISPPFIVAYMTQEIDPRPTDRVLEIGTGSGYQAAILSPLVKEVYTIEIVEALGKRAARTLKQLGYKNVFAKVGDGYLGWPDAAPFDKIIVTCSPEKVPQPLVDQLRDGGLMIVPVGERYQQNLYLYRKEKGELKSEALKPTLFVPMTGEAEAKRAVQPDSAHPSIGNGSFEEVLKDADSGAETPAGWHYQRQLTLVIAPARAAEGKRFVTFHNEQPGRGCHALQGFAVDGSKVAKLRLSFSARGHDIQPGPQVEQQPGALITFYDDRRATIGEVPVSASYVTSNWEQVAKIVAVPLKAREAILRIGLLGATGELSIDDVKITAAP
jgi:protein-L-isoaspartate(D-aspartate) O-methyltransferase